MLQLIELLGGEPALVVLQGRDSMPLRGQERLKKKLQMLRELQELQVLPRWLTRSELGS